MIANVGDLGWRIRAVGQGSSWGTVRRIVFAVDPNCAAQPHPTRDCRCRAFKHDHEAREYIRLHDDSVA